MSLSLEQEAVLLDITDFADKAHGDQVRKYTPERYIVHPVKVMGMCRQQTEEIPVLAAALLHDVLEDTSVTANEMHAFLLHKMTQEETLRTLQLVQELTDEFVKSKYPGMNRRTRKEKEMERLATISPDAQTIKYADIIDNCLDIVTHDNDFAKVFVNECNTLLKKLTMGNEQLRAKAAGVIYTCLQQLK